MSDERLPPLPVNKLVDAEKLRVELSFSDTNITSAMMEHASLYAFYGVQAARAAKQVDDIEMLLETTESKVDRRLRTEASDNGLKITEAALDKQVRLDPHIIRIRRGLNEAKQVESLAKSAVKAFEQRRDMLIQVGANLRKEADGEVSLNRRSAIADSAESQRDRVLALMNKPKVVEEV